MSLRNIIVQYVGDTLYLPPLEREVKHIIVGEYDERDWEHFEPVVRCRDCTVYDGEGYGCSYGRGDEPDGFCSWGERKEG